MAMENPFEGKEIWFGVGSQDLYGEEALRQVAAHSAEMVDYLNKTGKIPAKIVLKPTLKSPTVSRSSWLRPPPTRTSSVSSPGATPSPRPRCGSVVSKC